MGIRILKKQIGAFKGLYQGLDENLLDWAYSPDCQNMSVADGIMSTRKGIAKFMTTAVSVSDNTYGTGYAHKLMFLQSMTTDITGLTTKALPIIGVYFAGQNGSGAAYRWYSYNKTSAGASAATWNVITTNGSVVAMSNVNPDLAHYVEYKISGESYLIIAGGSAPYKLHVVYGAGPGYTYSVRAEALNASAPANVMYNALHRERVWFAGNINGATGVYAAGANTLYYPNAFVPTDWATAGETGSIVVETFDGDYIRNIANILDDVLIFKKNNIFKVIGDIPSEYAIQQVYSVQGAIFGDSVCSDGSYCFFAGDDGIYQYDGTVGKPLLINEIKTVFPTIANPKGLVTNNKLYMWDRQTIAGLAAYTGKCIVYDLLTKAITVNYTNDMYDAIVLDGNVLFTDGRYIYEI